MSLLPWLYNRFQGWKLGSRNMFTEEICCHNLSQISKRIPTLSTMPTLAMFHKELVQQPMGSHLKALPAFLCHANTHMHLRLQGKLTKGTVGCSWGSSALHRSEPLPHLPEYFVRHAALSRHYLCWEPSQCSCNMLQSSHILLAYRESRRRVKHAGGPQLTFNIVFAFPGIGQSRPPPAEQQVCSRGRP